MLRQAASAEAVSVAVAPQETVSLMVNEEDHLRLQVMRSGFALDEAWQEIDRIVPVVTDIIDETGAEIHALPYSAGAWEDRTSLMREIRREGVDV